MASNTSMDLMRAVSHDSAGTQPDGLTAKEVIQELVPDLSSLTWDALADVRTASRLSSFRKQIANIGSQLGINPKGDVVIEAHRKLSEAALELASEVEPNVSKAVLLGLIGNIPIPFANPVAVASAANEIYSAYKMEERFGWLFLLAACRRGVSVKLSDD